MHCTNIVRTHLERWSCMDLNQSSRLHFVKSEAQNLLQIAALVAIKARREARQISTKQILIPAESKISGMEL